MQYLKDNKVQYQKVPPSSNYCIDEECMICLGDFENDHDVIVLPCGGID